MSTTAALAPNKRLGLVLVLGALSAIGPLSVDMYLPAFTSISQDFQVPVARVESSLAAFFIGLSLGQLFYGPLADRFGRRRPLMLGMLVYIAATVGCALSASIEHLILFRFLQALGGCAGMVITRAIVRDLFEGSEAAKIFSLLMLVMGIAPILGPLLGGYILSVADWHMIFWVVGAIAIASLITLALWLPETHGPNPEVKLNQVASNYWAILKDPAFRFNTLAGGFAQAGMFTYITGSPFVFMELYGVKPENYGWFFGVNAAGLIFASQLNARLASRYRPDEILKVSLWITLAAGVSLFLLAPLGLGIFGVAVPLFFYVASLGVVTPNTTTGALANQAQRAGSASALIGTLQFILASIASGIISLSHAQSALPMAAVIGSLSILAMLSFQLQARAARRASAEQPSSANISL